jgi:ParB family chromosome partitioning protein
MHAENGFDALRDGKRSLDELQSGARPIIDVPVDGLIPGRYQPRQHLSEESLVELADSIREQGILQPLVVRRVPADDSADRSLGEHAGPSEPDRGRFEIVAGERRWHAAKLAGLATVPVIVRELDDRSALAVALIENLQREDLNPIDQAHSLQRLADEFALTHEQVAKAVGRSRASVSNLLRLLDLDSEVKSMLVERRIDMGHARALLSLDRDLQVEMARKAERRGMSVRQVEKAVRTLLDTPPAPADDRTRIDLQTRWLQLQLEKEVGEKITIRRSKNGTYSLSISFDDLGRLQRALQRILELIIRVREAAGPRARDAR